MTTPTTLNILQEHLEPIVELPRADLFHLLFRHCERHERRDSVDGVEIDLLKPLLIPSRDIPSPTTRVSPFGRLKNRQLDYLTGYRIHDLLISGRRNTVRPH